MNPPTNPTVVMQPTTLQTQWNQLVPSLPPQVGPRSTNMICRTCNSDIHTKTSRKAKASAWWCCILMCLLGCSCGCCLVPCCMDSFNVVNHSCPSCGSYLGQYRS